jgi:hypothetical protein
MPYTCSAQWRAGYARVRARRAGVIAAAEAAKVGYYHAQAVIVGVGNDTYLFYGDINVHSPQCISLAQVDRGRAAQCFFCH